MNRRIKMILHNFIRKVALKIELIYLGQCPDIMFLNAVRRQRKKIKRNASIKRRVLSLSFPLFISCFPSVFFSFPLSSCGRVSTELRQQLKADFSSKKEIAMELSERTDSIRLVLNLLKKFWVGGNASSVPKQATIRPDWDVVSTEFRSELNMSNITYTFYGGVMEGRTNSRCCFLVRSIPAADKCRRKRFQSGTTDKWTNQPTNSPLKQM